MRKLLAFLLAFTIAFSATGYMDSYAAASVSAEVNALVEIGMLVGDGNGVTREYTQKEMTRLTAAISILKLRGLYDDAVDYEGYANFVDKDEVKWAEGKNIMAYLKANPNLGFIGDERGRFGPYNNISEQSYYKVLLETLGYKQDGAGVSGDFSWNDTFKFAASIGLKPAKAGIFTIDLLAKATVAALKTSTKGGRIYINVLIDAGKIRRARALDAGLINDMTDAEVKSVRAVGNTVVEVVFKEEIERYEGENLDNYSIEGLTVKSAALAGEDRVRLVTSAQSSGKLYTLKIGDEKIKFTGVAKISGSPRIKSVKSEDVETVIIEFDKELDLATATDISNYSISGVEIDRAELEGKKVTLTTYGLAGRKQYTVKVRDVKSIDGVALKSDSKSFYTRLDTTPPSLKDAKAETNQRVVVKFSEAVTRASAEDMMNYLIKSSSGELEILEARLTGDDEDTVELTTESQKSGTKYELTVENIVDKTKAANIMKRPAKKTFYGMKIDTTPPQLSKADLKVLSRNHIQVAFTDSSRIDEAAVLDPGSYEVAKNDRYKESIYVEDVEKVSYADGKFKVMLRVEDLTISSSYTVTAYNIADEFGNTLERNNSGTVNVARDDFAAATVKDYKVVGGSKLEIYFTKPLDEESAEDISNYEINNSIGAPIEAVYKDEKVTLETGAMTEGKIYKISIDGVKDLTGNRLKLSFEFRAMAGENDFQGPRLEYVYSVNKYVVAAAFDKPVRYTASGNNRTALVLKSGSKTITLYAKAMADDDRTIEFSNIEGGKTISGYGVYKIEYKESFWGIEDRTVNKNKFDRESLPYFDIEIYGSDEEPEAPEILYITQRDGKTFEMEMSKEVTVIDKDINTIGSPSASFDVKTDGEDAKLVAFIITSPRYIDDSKEYKVDISKILTDKHGIKAENTHSGYTMLYGEYKDEDKPYILTVSAVDRMTVEVEYSEAIGYEGRYTIKNTDDYAKYRTISNSLKKIDRNRVILSLGQPLESRYEYILIIESQAKDLVGNTSEDLRGDEFYFMGTDLAPVKVPDLDEEENRLAAEKVMVKISDLPQTIRLADKAAVESALSSYNALTEKQKRYVDNYGKLEAARVEISRLEGDKNKVEEDKLKAAAVDKKINELPKLRNIKLENKRAVEDARAAYDALTNAQRYYVTAYSKLTAAEARIAELEKEYKRQEEERKRIEEERKAGEEARIALADKAVKALEAAVHESLEVKVAAMMSRAAELKALTDALALVNEAIEQAQAAAAAAQSLVDAALEAVGKLEAGAVKAALEARAGAAINKIEKAAEAIREVRDKISNEKDMLDVEDAKAWLTADKLVFSPVYAAHHKEPRILALKPHANGASYRFAEADTVVYGRFARPGGKKEEKTASLEIMKGTGDIKITRGKYDAAITFKVKISKGKAMAEKLFKVNIPATGNVTVEAL